MNPFIHKYWLRSNTRTALIETLNANGFNYDSAPEANEAQYNSDLSAWCIYLAKPILTPATFDEEGNELAPAVISTHWCANVRSKVELEWSGILLDTSHPNNPAMDYPDEK
jgi:hypothetical protein